MAARRWTTVCGGMLLAGTQLFTGMAAGTGPDPNRPPRNGRLANVRRRQHRSIRPAASCWPRRDSELRLMAQRYNIDRSTLNGNYDGRPRPRRTRWRPRR